MLRYLGLDSAPAACEKPSGVFQGEGFAAAFSICTGTQPNMGVYDMAVPLWSNFVLNARAGTLLTYLNGLGANLRLFTNIFTPTPASTPADFTEANFVGYAAIPMNGKFTGPAFVIDGEYQLTADSLTFTCASGPGQTIQGWWIDDGTNLIAAGVFTPAESVSPGNPLVFTLRPQEISQSIL